MTETDVVTVFLRNRGDVLLLRRSDDVDSYAGKWGTVAGHVENEDPEASARSEIEEETGLTSRAVSLVREGTPFPVEDEDRETRWIVHPFLFDSTSRSVDPNWETDQVEWTSPTLLLRRDTVPELWISYRRVAPSIVELTNDTTHGSAYLSIRALEVLRNRSALLATTDAPDIEDAKSRLVEVVQRLLDARPSMAAVGNRIHRVMHESRPDLSPDRVEKNAHAAIERALSAETEAAQNAAEEIAGKRVLTLSRSGTVRSALRRADPAPSVVVAESRPGGEGVGVAESLVDEELDVTLIPDAAIATTLANGRIDAVLVGADTVTPSGGVINKVGTRTAALAADQEEVPFFAACTVDKISVEESSAVNAEADPRSVYDGPAKIDVSAPRFDLTPRSLITGIITDRDRYLPNEIATIADEMNELRHWRSA